MPNVGHARALAALLLITLAVAACGSSGSDVSARKVDATSTTSAHTTNAASDSTGNAEETTSSSTTAKPTTTTPNGSPTTATQRSSGDVLTFDELWSRRDELAGTSLTVDGKVMFNLTCPPQMPEPGGCNASAWLTGDGVDDLGPDPSSHAMRLYDDGAAVSCASDQSTGLDCRGWRQGGRYRLDGVPDHEVAGGRTINTFRFNTTHHTSR